MNLSAVILAGGESRRMRRDKAWMLIDGQPLIARAVDMMRNLGVSELFISGRPGADYSALGERILLDLEPGMGPLGGIERALHLATSSLVLVLAVDLPRMTTAFLRKLVARCDDWTGVVPELNGHLEPLVAVYPKCCHAIAANCLIEPSHAARDFANACLAEHAVKTHAVAPNDVLCFTNWNIPSDVAL